MDFNSKELKSTVIFQDFTGIMCRGGIKNKELGLWGKRGLLANVSAGVSVTTECLSGGKWLLYTMALWP